MKLMNEIESEYDGIVEAILVKNEDVVEWFIDKDNNFTPEPFTLPDPLGRVETGMLTLWPHRHGTDGFFIAKLHRKG